jgi:hypothetical protein
MDFKQGFDENGVEFFEPNLNTKRISKWNKYLLLGVAIAGIVIAMSVSKIMGGVLVLIPLLSTFLNQISAKVVGYSFSSDGVFKKILIRGRIEPKYIANINEVSNIYRKSKANKSNSTLSLYDYYLVVEFSTDLKPIWIMCEGEFNQQKAEKALKQLIDSTQTVPQHRFLAESLAGAADFMQNS